MSYVELVERLTNSLLYIAINVELLLYLTERNISKETNMFGKRNFVFIESFDFFVRLYAYEYSKINGSIYNNFSYRSI